jgi:hypothetical protein
VGVLTLSHQPLLVGALAAVCMSLASLASIGFLTSLLVATPEEKVGRVQSAASFLSSLVQPLGPLAAGALLSTLGVTATFGILGCVFTGCAVIVTWAPSVRRGAAPRRLTQPGIPAEAAIADG